MTKRRPLSQLAALLLAAMAAITAVAGGPSVAYAQALSQSSSTKVSFQVVATTTTTLPTTTTTTPAPSISPPHSSAGGALPLTGGPFAKLAEIAFGLAATGALLAAVVRRRPTRRQS
jgi:hypothetical protein